MKTYDFAPIAAREYPTIQIMERPYIWGGVQFSLIVSEKPYSIELMEAMAKHGIEWQHCPVSEDEGADWYDSLMHGLLALYNAHKKGKKMIVHCDLGNNRSKSFVEAFYYMLTGKYYHDEYKGSYNHLIYNGEIGHLPIMKDLELPIKRLLTTGNVDDKEHLADNVLNQHTDNTTLRKEFSRLMDEQGWDDELRQKSLKGLDNLLQKMEPWPTSKTGRLPSTAKVRQESPNSISIAAS